MRRRKFIKSNIATAMTLTGSSMFLDFLHGKPTGDSTKSYSDYLRKSAVPKEDLDILLNENSWAQFDPEVGYILGNYTA